jgi:NADH:ubiquinone oxidoreductase subunit 5 (subunit L)/multisubunit Na+/H+ antiporter MnhA subunit
MFWFISNHSFLKVSAAGPSGQATQTTLRQLGLMIITISIGLSSLVFFYLLTHALFNALLFMCAGGIIHSMGDSHDIRLIGGMSVYMLLLLHV